MTTKKLAAFLCAALAAGTTLAAPLDDLGAKVVASLPPGVDVSIAETGPSGTATLVSGKSPNQDRAFYVSALKPDTSFRLASNTKTYVAATVLRLWEDGQIKLDASIRDYVNPAWIAALDKDGYDTAKITVRHLLSHTSGLADHAQTKQFVETITTNPHKAWTRQDEIDALVAWTDPLSAPGAQFHYSDDGYCLLGNIIERLTHKPLAAAVREEIGFSKLGLNATYWETQEPAAPKAGPRAHQFFAGHDTYDWNPSLDMYGGGGLVSTPQDMARFLRALFEGKVFRHPETLQTMISREGLPADSPYRLGIFEYDAGGMKAYGHSGFWGTAAMYVPAQHRAYAFAVTRQDAFKPTFEQLKAWVGSAK